MAGRSDYKGYFAGARRMRNFIPTPQGPIRKRPGTHFVAAVKTQTDRTWLYRFEFNQEQAYVLEFGNLYIRFYSNHGVVGAPFEVVTPWTIAMLTGADETFQLRFAQSGDTLYIVHPQTMPYKLVRTAPAAFTLSRVLFTNGPFQPIPIQTGTTETLYWTGAKTVGSAGVITSSNIFHAWPRNFGAYVRLESKKVDANKQWEPGKVIAINDIRRSDGKTYHALNAANTGTIRPTHSEGARFDGDAGVQWQYDDSNFGIIEIGDGGAASVGANVNGTVRKQLPDQVIGAGNATTRWSETWWGNQNNIYPDTVVFFRERLLFMVGRRIWGSVVGDFENHADRDDGGVVTIDSAVSLDITSDRANNIVWAIPSQEALLVGTAGDEHAIFEATNAEAFGPGNTAARKQSEYGARHTPAFTVGEGAVFVQKSGRKIRDMKMAESVNARWIANNMAVLAEHLTKSGIIDMCYQQEPNSVIWTVTADRRLTGFTMDREQEVKGWHSHRIGGYSDASNTTYAYVESIITIPSPLADRDELWMIVRRVIGGVTKRYVEWMEYDHEERDDPQDAFYVDSGLTLNNTVNATLQPGAGCTIVGSINVPFVAGAGVFVAGDVGRRIHYRFPTTNVKGETLWNTAIALITGFTAANQVTGTIEAAFPEILNPSGASGGLLSVTVTDTGNAYPPTVTPVVNTVGGGGAGAVLQAHMAVRGAKYSLFGNNYIPGDIQTLVGGVFSRPATFKCFEWNQVISWQVLDGGDYTVTPAKNDGFDGNTTTSSGAGTGATCSPDWCVASVAITNPGAGFTSTPAITFSAPVPVVPFIGSGVTPTAVAAVTPGGSVGTGTTPQIPALNWRLTVTTVTGLNHLEGEIVDVHADGITHTQRRVIGGSITLNPAASKAHVGFPCPSVYSPMAIDAGSANGTAQAKTKRAPRVMIKFHDSGGVKYGRDEDKQLDVLPELAGGALFTGNVKQSWPDGYATDLLLTIIADKPLPCTITGLYPIMETQDDV